MTQDTYTMVNVHGLKFGDQIDLAGDPYADPASDNPAYECEHSLVAGIELETPNCVRVDFEAGPSVGFPVDHMVKLHKAKPTYSTVNYSVQDLLDKIAHWGSVNIRRTRFPSAASDNLLGEPVAWVVTLRIPGYLSEGVSPSFETKSNSIFDAVVELYEKVEEFLFSEDGRAARQKYLEVHEAQSSYAKRVNPHNAPGHAKPRHLKAPLPDVISKDAIDIKNEVYGVTLKPTSENK